MSHRVKVKYNIIRSNGGSSSGSATMTVQGKSESYLLNELRKKHPNCEIIIIEMDWLS